MNITTDYPLLIALYLVAGLVIHNTTDSKPFMPSRFAFAGWTWYGIFSAVGIFIGMLMVSRCNINLILAAFVLVAPVFLRFAICRGCSKSYNITLWYLTSIPLILFWYECPEIATITAALAVAAAFGRLGCISAGCCEGPETSCANVHYKYPDYKQLVNQNNGKESTCTQPTIVYENILLFIIAWLCLRYPAYSPLIFGVGTSLALFVSKLWRNRPKTTLAALVLLLVPLVCLSPVGVVCPNPKQPNITTAMIVAFATGLVISKDLFQPDGSRQPQIQQTNKQTSTHTRARSQHR